MGSIPRVPVLHVQSYNILLVPPKMELISSDTATKGRQSTDLSPDITSFIRDISLLLHHTFLEPDDQRRDQLISMKLQMPHNCSIDIGCLRCLRVVLIDGFELADALPAGYRPLHREVPRELVKDRVTHRSSRWEALVAGTLDSHDELLLTSFLLVCLGRVLFHPGLLRLLSSACSNLAILLVHHGLVGNSRIRIRGERIC